MILEQTISVLASLSLITVIVILIFTIKFRNFKKNFFKNFYELPSIIVTGPAASGKKSIISNVTRDRIVSHPFEDNLKISYLSEGDKKIQMISLPYNFIDDFVNSEDFKKMNSKLFINVFDVSTNSDDIEDQIRDFEKNSAYFDHVDKILIANKTDIADSKKLKKLETKFKKIHKTSSATKEGLEKLRDSILQKIK